MGDKFLDNDTRLLLLRMLFGVSAVSAISSFWLFVRPPVLTNPRIEADIYAAQVRGQSYDQPVDTRWSNCLGALLGMLSLTAGYSGSKLANGDPVSLTTPTLETIADRNVPDVTIDTVQPSTVRSELDNVKGKIVDAYLDNPWLEDVVDATGSLQDMLIIIGNPGSGKSCLASSIALLRHIMHDQPCYTLDLDANLNVERGTWVHGEIVGMTKDAMGKGAGKLGRLPYRDQHLRARAIITERLENEGKPITIIHDECQRLVPKGGLSPEELESIYADYTAFRKRGDKAIFLWHGASNAQSGLSYLPKGVNMLQALLDYATVIDFNDVPADKLPVKNRKSKEKNRTTFRYKPAGLPFTDQAGKSYCTIPAFLEPGRLIKMMRKSADIQNVGAKPFSDPDLEFRQKSLKKRIDDQLPNTDALKKKLESTFYEQNAGKTYDLPYDFDGSDLYKEFLEFEYEFEKELTARNIFRAWGRNRVAGEQRFESQGDMIEFFNQCQLNNLGRWEDKAWQPLFEITQLS